MALIASGWYLSTQRKRSRERPKFIGPCVSAISAYYGIACAQVVEAIRKLKEGGYYIRRRA